MKFRVHGNELCCFFLSMDVLLILVLDVMGRPCCVKVSSRRHGTSHKPTCVGNRAELSAGPLYMCGRQASFSAKFAANPLFFLSTESGASKDPFFRGTACAGFFCCCWQRSDHPKLQSNGDIRVHQCPVEFCADKKLHG